MPKQTLFIALGALTIILIAAAAWAWMTFSDDKPEPNTNSVNTNQTQQPANTNSGEPAPQTNTNTETTGGGTVTGETGASEKSKALQTARIFVERYGTYSNRNNFENIRNVLPFMTSRFETESQNFLASNTASKPDEPFYGITTSALSIAATEYEEGKSATVQISTQRTETKADEAPRVFTQDVVVKAVSVSGIWKIDALQWK